MSRRLLEVIALGPADAQAARAGGADRLELVGQMSADGLSPTPEVAAAVVAATDLPVRAMLRTTPDFLVGDGLEDVAEALLATGVDGLVFGFLDGNGDVDAEACERIAARMGGRPLTFHRAVDNARNPYRAWDAALKLSGVDAVLTAGSAAGVAEGLDLLTSRAPSGRVLAGGGLRPELVAPLVAAGVSAFHIGRTARRDGSWSAPVCAETVARWRSLIDATSIPARGPWSP